MPLVRKTLPGPAKAEPDWRAQAALLQAGTPEERFSAARALADAPRAVAALEAALGDAKDPRLVEAICTSLARQDSPAAFAAVLRQLRSDDAQSRSFALDAMRLMRSQTERQLPALLADDDPDIRLLACELALQIPAQPACALLAALLQAETQVNVCAAAVEALAQIGTPAELPALLACGARFPEAPFLEFSAGAAVERIRARAGS